MWRARAAEARGHRRPSAARRNDGKSASLRRIVFVLLLIRAKRIRLRHGDDIVTGIDEMNLAGDAGREVGEQIERSTAKLFERHAAAKRRIPLLEGKHHTRLADAGAG